MPIRLMAWRDSTFYRLDDFQAVLGTPKCVSCSFRFRATWILIFAYSLCIRHKGALIFFVRKNLRYIFFSDGLGLSVQVRGAPE